MNKCVLIGNLTRDPELQTTPTGISVCRFGLAVNRNYTNAQGEKDVDFFNCVAWRGLGENCGKFLTKGAKVGISGRIETRTYDKDGVRHHATDIVCDDVEFLTPRTQGAGTGGYANIQEAGEPIARKKGTATLTPVEDDGLPF